MTDRSDILPPDGDGSDEDAARAAEYVLGLLDAPEHRAFEARLLEEPDLRRLVADWETQLAPMFDGVDPVEAPADVWRKIEARLFADQTPPLPWWRRLGLGQAVLGATVAAALTWVAMTQGWLLPDTIAPQVVAELQGEGALYAAVVAVDTEASALIVTRTTAAPAEGRDHELWLIVGEAAPVSLGVLPRNGVARIRLDADTTAVLNGATIAVSDEPAGGSITGAPTGAVLAASPVSLS